ncbi:hypothetical protein LCGC14_1251380 [marine sediment metagenome]|uniref:Uncharacterized protein n=1 Tax=marine sediment metagenome TaxID=412755 RepID=A0A0F9P6U8_9ZZZZ
MNKQEKIREGFKNRLNWLTLENKPLDVIVKESLEYLKSQGAKVTVERELPELKKLEGEATLKEKMAYLSGVEDYRAMLKKAGWCAYEEII